MLLDAIMFLLAVEAFSAVYLLYDFRSARVAARNARRVSLRPPRYASVLLKVVPLRARVAGPL